MLPIKNDMYLTYNHDKNGSRQFLSHKLLLSFKSSTYRYIYFLFLPNIPVARNRLNIMIGSLNHNIIIKAGKKCEITLECGHKFCQKFEFVLQIFRIYCKKNTKISIKMLNFPSKLQIFPSKSKMSWE